MDKARGCRCLAFTTLFFGGSCAFSPIQWLKFPDRTFLLAPEGFPSAALVPPQKLTLTDRPGNSFPSLAFTARPDNSITWDANGWCVQAPTAADRGEHVVLDRCTGGPAQKWSVVSDGRGRKMIQLQGSSKCLDVALEGDSAAKDSFDGAPIGLRECQEKASESWLFEPDFASAHDHSQISAHSLSKLSMLISGIALALLGVLSLRTWMHRSHEKARVIGQGKPLCLDEGGASLTVPLPMRRDDVPMYPIFDLSEADMVPAVMVLGEQVPEQTIDEAEQTISKAVTCPKCAAFYKVDESLFKQNRRVRCSVCNYEWMQQHDKLQAWDQPPHLELAVYPEKRRAKVRIGSDHLCSRLYVGGMPYTVGEDDLKALFEPYGVVTECFIPKDDDNKSKGFGFVSFSDTASGEEAVREMNGQRIGSRSLKVSKSQSSYGHVSRTPQSSYVQGSSNAPPKIVSYRCFIGNMDRTMDVEELRSRFEPFGTITNVNVPLAPAGHNKGYAFVSFDSSESVDKAVEELDQTDVRGRPMSVRKCEDVSRPPNRNIGR